MTDLQQLPGERGGRFADAVDGSDLCAKRVVGVDTPHERLARSRDITVTRLLKS